MKACHLLCAIFVIALSQQGHGREIQEEIFNGYNAVRGQFPFMTLLRLQSEQTGQFMYCGGTLISTRYILSAAHCFFQANMSQVYVGEVSNTDKTGVKLYIVSKEHITVHPQFNHTTFLNDVAILKLPQDVTTNQYVGIIQLAKKAMAPSNTFDNQIATAVGWGRTRDDEKGRHNTLQFRNMHIFNHSDCVQTYSNIGQVTDGMICIDRNIINAGTCKGDSGGPLMVNGTDNKPIQIGITSWSVGTCSSKHPNVFTNVAYYLDWINSISGVPIS